MRRRARLSPPSRWEARPEFATADTKAGRVYDNIEDKNEVVAIDTKTHQVVNHWPIAPGEGASGMAIDVAHHRLFLGCGNKLMVMMDSETGKVVASVPIGQGVDANAFDPGTQYAFASCGGDGTVTIAHEDAPDKLTVVQTLATERGSRTMTLDPKTHRIYLAAAKYEAPGSRERPPVVGEDAGGWSRQLQDPRVRNAIGDLDWQVAKKVRFRHALVVGRLCESASSLMISPLRSPRTPEFGAGKRPRRPNVF